MSDLILAGRRGFLARALGLVALPAAAAMPAAPLPTISADVVTAMDAYRRAYREHDEIYQALHRREFRLRTNDWSKLTPEGERYMDLAWREQRAKDALWTAVIID